MTEITIETMTLKIKLCIAALLAEALSSAPINLEINEFPPAPIPFPNPTIIMKSGVMYPRAAKGSAPSPATHILSIILFAKIKKIDLEGIIFDIYYKGKFYCTANTSLVGEYNVINIILAVGIAIKLGLTSNQIVNGIAKLRPVESRMQTICLDSGAIVINNGYNSNPNSIKESLKLLGLYKDRKKIVITPGFVEMGKEQYKLNYELGKLISRVADECYVVNKINREAILCGLKDSNFDNKIVIVNKFKEIEFSVFNSNSVILIENDLPDNYI